MKKFISLLFCSLAIFQASFSQTDAEKSVQQALDAYGKNPVEALQKMASDDFSFIIAEGKVTDKKAAIENINILYIPVYSASFEILDYKYAQIVLNIYKDYDNNSFNKKDAYADTVSMDVADGGTIRGKDVLINSLKTFRNSITTVKNSIVTYVVLKPKDKDETWVSIWSNEINTYKNGNIDTSKINENWKFNKDGKVAYINVYTAK